HKRNIGSNINEILEVTQTKSNKTYIIKTYFNNLYINKTTTKPQKQKHCGNCGNDKNNIIFKIKDEYQIHKLTKTYERKIQDFSNIFSLDIIHYAIEYAGEKAVTSPTNLLLTILSNWKQAGVQTLEQAKGQENNYRKGHDTGNTSSEVKSIEKTPQWLLDKQNEKNNDKDQDEMSEEEKIAFEKEREALLKEIESFWT
ncbi:TPA: DnaD domain protein, partial [Staphylococcus aureus]